MTLLCFGTRPEWLKIKPLVKLLKKEEAEYNTKMYQLLFTGQHEDLLSDILVDERIHILHYSDSRLDNVIINCLMQFPDGDFDSILVQGDTVSAFACALAAYNRKLKIYYLEAGLRSYNLKHPYPEEGYRQMISRISDINLCPTELSKENLDKERVSGKNIVIGNTVLDNLLKYKDNTTYSPTVLVTLHRRENHHIMDRWFTEVNKLAKKYDKIDFVLPIHPNPNVKKHKGILTHVRTVDPLEHDQLLTLLAKCRLVISDSGGLQEEGSFLNKKVIVCREVTERPEAIETGHLHLCKTPEELGELFDTLNEISYINKDCPYGDGRSSERIVNLL